MATSKLEKRIKNLEDIEEIKKLQANYAYLIDSFQLEGLANLFVDDITAEFAPLGKFNNKTELMSALKGLVELNSMSCHQAMTPLIKVDGDRATGMWYLFGPFTSKTPNGEVAHWIQGKYENEYVREKGEWKFKKIVFHFNLRSPYEDGWVKTRMM
jgi:hypothetical protein